MKLAKVFPIHKGGDETDSSDYIPILNLLIISKYLKKKKTFDRFLNKHKLIHRVAKLLPDGNFLISGVHASTKEI